LNGNLYIADSGNAVIRKISCDEKVSTLAGIAGNKGHRDGHASQALFSFPDGVTTDMQGNVYVAVWLLQNPCDYDQDSDTHTIRKISYDGQVSTLAGSPGS
jgi:sugar lactone lactonase YvrE